MRKGQRMATSNEPSPLLISFWKPHKPVTLALISRWIKELLTNTETQKCQRTFIKSGVFINCKDARDSTADILDMAGWSRKSTFERFYYKPVEGNNFLKAVLSCSQGKFLNHTLSYIDEALPRRGIVDLTKICKI